jgi:rhamnosyltransferase
VTVTQSRSEARPRASIVIPSKNGGTLFERALQTIFAQRTPWPFEVIVVDSGSDAQSLEILRRFPVRLHAIPPRAFNHGQTRDLGASLAKGEHLVFLNQDAVPCSHDWLVTLLKPLGPGNEYAAVQGGIREFSDQPRFFWDSCGSRFYFTRESERWIPRYGGIGFSTVNAAIRRSTWETCPFGEAVIMEDKKWQRAAYARGFHIAYEPDAAVFHTHNYDLRALIRRCQQEGFGWRLVGERYSFTDMLRDTLSCTKYRDLWRGLWDGNVRTSAELLFPVLRPWLVFRGNRLLRRYPV